MSAAISFASDGREVLREQLASPDASLSVPAEQLAAAAAWITRNGYRCVALQFPDTLLQLSCDLCWQLEEELCGAVAGSDECELFVLADTAHGGCCVDRVAASHYSADSLVHFGPACLTPIHDDFPVFYVFGRLQATGDLEGCQSAFSAEFHPSDPVLIFYDFSCMDMAMQLFRRLESAASHVKLTFSLPDFPKHAGNPKADVSATRSVCNRLIPASASLSDSSLFYIGPSSAALTNLSHSLAPQLGGRFVAFDPVRGVSERVSIGRPLGRRYFLVEKARDARTVGILVATLGVADYLSAIERVQAVARRAAKTAYVLSVGKLNPAKLANFAELDIFVIIACPENSVIDSTDFYRPIVTPYEFELACNEERPWSGRLVTDFRRLLAGGADFVTLPDHPPPPDVSLLTGAARVHGDTVAADADDGKSSAAAGALVRSEEGALHEWSSSVVGDVSRRSWRGLEQRLGADEPAPLQPGTSGRAMRYSHECS